MMVKDKKMDVTNYYLLLSALLFSLGTLGVIVRRNIIVILMCIELMLNAVNLSLVALAREFGSVDGHVYVFFVMTVAAAEAAVGLAILVGVFRNFYDVDTDVTSSLKG